MFNPRFFGIQPPPSDVWFRPPVVSARVIAERLEAAMGDL
jgi:hypothetical protein